ncbi:MAG: DMT family transporter [Gaiellales bacterium]
MDAVALALLSALGFGAMTVLLRPALGRGTEPLLGAFATVVVAFCVAFGATVIRGDWTLAGVAPYLLAGVLGPGVSQILFTYAVREAGPSRTSATVGIAPLFAVVFAVAILDEPLLAAIALGALAIVVGGVLLATESERPDHVNPLGLGLALVAALTFATRDTFVRSVATDSAVSPELAITATLASGGLTILAAMLVTRVRLRAAPFGHFLPAGVAFGISYVSLYEAFYRGRLSVVAPLVATECLWGLTLSHLFFGRHERIGRRLVAGAALVVAGGALIGLER